MELTKPLNKYIDHTLLQPVATNTQFEEFLDEAVKYQFASVCVSPYMAIPVKAALNGEDVKVCTVVGFPLGFQTLESKLHEISHFISNGIDEIDFVFNYGDLKSELYDNVGKEIDSIGSLCYSTGTTSKCIIETCVLTEDEKTFMYRLLTEHSQIDYIKTSTGFAKAGAHTGDVLKWNARRQEAIDREASSLIQLVIEDFRKRPLKIKAAGGIRDLKTAMEFIAVGADRLGTSGGVKIMEEYIKSEA